MKSEDEIRAELAEQREYRDGLAEEQTLAHDEERSLEMANERILMIQWVLEEPVEDDRTTQ
jgi:hypothetical protein